jgi:hypothetical protein
MTFVPTNKPLTHKHITQNHTKSNKHENTLLNLVFHKTSKPFSSSALTHRRQKPEATQAGILPSLAT